MIEVKGLTKVYKSRKGGKCVALDHISFTLPDRGFLFVVGKSGSGKTTLLSLLGGLDTVTSGEIIENGRHIEKFSLGEQVYYRNSTIGFIFQDFHLVDDLTIYENVLLALQLQGEKDGEKVMKALEETGLAEYRDRYPKELSGGQQQRVAIARALVKEPSIILADEPTGNLDSKTTVQILDLLKALSKTKLVVIVSHNLSDAEHYADEIMELSDGKILQHVRRNSAFDPRLRVEGDTLVIPSGQEFSEEEFAEVNSFMKKWYLRGARPARDRFLPMEGRKRGTMPEGGPLEKRHLRFGQRVKLAGKFTRRGALRACAYAVILAAIMVVLGLSQLIMNFNGGEVIAKEMAKRDLSCTSFIKDDNDTYERLDTTRIVDVEEGDLRKFYDAGYEGKAYPLINYSFYLTSDTVPVFQRKLTPKGGLYDLESTRGLLVTEESFVERAFGKLEYAALAEEQRSYGVFLTDFVADVLRAARPADFPSYESFLGQFAGFTLHKYGYINGIIDTGYKKRHGDLVAKLGDPRISREELSKIAATEEYLTFYDELYQYLSIAYSFNPNVAEELVSPAARQFVSAGISAFEYGGKTFTWQDNHFSYAGMKNSVPLRDNEILMNYAIYNAIFQTNYTPQTMGTFTPHEVKYSYYRLCDRERSQKKFEMTLKIVGLANYDGIRCNVADNVFLEMQKAELFTFGYYFDNADQTALLFNVAEENGFLPNSAIGGSITTMTKAVGVFSDFFDLIFIVLCAALLLLMVQFEVKCIKDKMKEIGILKALGARESDLLVLFGLQIALTGVLMILLYIAGSFVFIGLANKVLVVSLNELAKNSVVLDLAFLVVKWKYIWQNCLLALLILAVSFLVPMLRLRRIRPTNVIKAKE